MEDIFIRRFFKNIKTHLIKVFFYLFTSWNHWVFYIKKGYLWVYNILHVKEILFFILFLLHQYSPKQFNPLSVKHNLRILARLKPYEGLSVSRHGVFKIIPRGLKYFLFSMWNILLGGSLQSRVEKAVLYTYLTVTLELNNPFTKKVLLQFLEQKLSFLERHLNYVKKINGRLWDQSEIRVHMQVFERNSLLQARIIETMHRAVLNQREPEIIQSAKIALKKGLHPLLVTKGVSGSYWMRSPRREILGLFKPFDEEIFAPHNPVGARFQGALGLRRTRSGCRVGESPHHEVGAFVVDEFFGFGIVPKTYYAEFSHTTFYNAREDPFSSRRSVKTKLGSFQEFVQGFVPVDHLSLDERASIPLDEFQLLVVLDVIIGNTDRHIGNILFGDDKIAAIDHGLSFPDRGDEFSFWYWRYFHQGKEILLPSIVELLNHFPFQELSLKLHKKCFISLKVLQRMHERVILFTAAINEGLVPSQLENLFKKAYLDPLQDLSSTLKQAAIKQVQLFQEEYL